MSWIAHFFRWLGNTLLAVLGNVDQAFVTLYHRFIEGLTYVSLHTFLPMWMVTLIALLVPPVVVGGVYQGFFAMVTWLERKALARIQNRLGPNRAGPFGLLQPAADGIKMFTKEDIIPRSADKFLHTLAPMAVVVPALVLFSVLPYGRNMIPADLNVGVIFFFAVSSMATISLFIAGWSSHNKYSLLGALRAIAQMISYEIPVVMTAVPAIMIAGSLQISKIVTAQGPHEGDVFFGSVVHWYVWKPWGMVGFIAFFVSAMVELNRSPFDLAEGESEIIAGFHTEYSGFKFALFFLGEYLGAIAATGLTATLYLGGWWGPSILPSWIWFFLKMFTLLCIMIWLRGTLPRMRVDQLMGFAWKFMLPLALVNIIATAVWHYVVNAQPGRHHFGLWIAAWAASAAILLPTYILLCRINAGPALEKRNYRYASL